MISKARTLSRRKAQTEPVSLTATAAKPVRGPLKPVSEGPVKPVKVTSWVSCKCSTATPAEPAIDFASDWPHLTAVSGADCPS